jgi:hypothetical protein
MLWQSVVTDFSGCLLTNHRDKLMAIAGLASALSRRSGLAYFEGIWMEMAPYGLAWTCYPASGIPESVACDYGETPAPLPGCPQN